MSTKKTGWIGLGKMGIPMTQQLINAGYPVTVYNRSKEKEASLQASGASTAASPAELIQQTEVVIIMVSDDKAIQEIFTGEQGLLSAATTGKYIVNMSTVSPAVSKEMASLSAKQGNHYLDAPVSGSVPQAETGQLVIMVGGDSAAFEAVKPILEHLGKLVLLVGETGAGNAAKLAINTLLAIHAQGLSEAVVLAEQNGIKADDLLLMINNSALASRFNQFKGEAILNNNYEAAFALKHIAKDLRLAKDIGLKTPLAEAAYQTFQQAEATHGQEDIIAIIKQVKD